MRRLVLVCALLLSLLATAARAQQTAQEVYDKARQEGSLTIWSSLDIDLQHHLAAAFAVHYPGIKVTPFRIEPGPAVERAIAESRAGRPEVDALDMNVAYLQLLFDRNLVPSFPYTQVLGVPVDQVAFDSRAVIIGQYSMPITFNTSLVQASQITSWDDLLDPKWRGKILLERRGFELAVLANAWGDAKTTDYIHRLLQNQPIITKGAQGTAEALAGGQAAIALGAYAARMELLKQDGAPVDWARVGPIPAQLVVIVPMADAPHPNAARLWLGFWGTAEAQKIFYDDQRYGLVTGRNLSPRGEELRKDGIKVVLDSTNLAESRRQLDMVSRAIGSIQ